MLAAALRDLHRKYPGKFITDAQTASPEIWKANPYVTPLEAGDPDVAVIDCHYPLINRANRAPFHFLHGYIHFLNARLGLQIEPTEFKGDIHLSQDERSAPSQVAKVLGSEVPFWLIGTGGKFDFTIKWWDVRRYQAVVDHFRGRILFAQVGAGGDYHPPLDGVLDLRGQTDLRELILLVHHAQGVLCPVTLLMHLAAAVETLPKRPKNRACVVVAGGREPMHWTAYPHHQFLHTGGMLKCCEQGGCWRSRTVPIGDGDERDGPDQLCVDVVAYRGAERQILGGAAAGRLASPAEDVQYLPRCMDMITAEDAIRRIEMYFHGDGLAYLSAAEVERTRVLPRGVALEEASGETNGRPPAAAPKTAASGPRESIQEQRRLLDRCAGQEHPFPKGRFRGRGIVICGGGEKYFPCAWVAINLLRHLDCQLPIELWYNGPAEMTDRMREIVAPLRVVCVDAAPLRQEAGERPLHGWELKPYAIIQSRFREVMLLDADNVPVRNPEFLFECQGYRETGALFWPDIRKLGRHRPIWSICGIPYREEWEWESGQVVVSKDRCWKALQLAMHFNEESAFFYQHFLGDKESFHLAWRKLRQPCVLPSRRADWRFDVLLQYDHEGNLLFQHRNGHKWRRGANARVPGFLHEEQCLAFLRQLDGLLSGDPEPRPKKPNSPRERKAVGELITGEYRLGRAGQYRTVHLTAGGRLVQKDQVADWSIGTVKGSLRLTIHAAGRPADDLWKEKDGTWRGTSADGKEELELLPLPERLGVAPVEPRRRLTGGAAGEAPNGAATPRGRAFAEVLPRIIHLVDTETAWGDRDVEKLKSAWAALHHGWECRVWREEMLAELPGLRRFGSLALTSGSLRRAAVAHRFGGVCISSSVCPRKSLEPLLGMVTTEAFASVGPPTPRYHAPVSGAVLAALPRAATLGRALKLLGAAAGRSHDFDTVLTQASANCDEITIFPRHIFHPAPAEVALSFASPSVPDPKSTSGDRAVARTPFILPRCHKAWTDAREAQVLATAQDESWSEVFPILTDAEAGAFATEAKPSERAEVEGYFAVERIVNHRPAGHILATSLFWKHVDVWNPELPPLTLDTLMNARRLGLVKRFDPWEHYVQPLLRGAALLSQKHPEITLRVYLAGDLSFLIPMLAEHCEVRVMRSSSVRAQPGMMWRFLAFEDGEDLVSIIDADMIERGAEGIIRLTESLRGAGLGSWRGINDTIIDGDGIFVYRPMVGCSSGTRVRLPMRRLLEGFTWHHLRGRFVKEFLHPVHGRVPHFLHPWAGYGLDEWFLATAVYPRLLPYGMLTSRGGSEPSLIAQRDLALAAAVFPGSRMAE